MWGPCRSKQWFWPAPAGMPGSPRTWAALSRSSRKFSRPGVCRAAYYIVSGHLGHISEVAAIQRALRELPPSFDAVVSLGGESFLVYLLTDGRITNVLSHNKCAAGSGEFFVQQIGRMGLGLEEAIRRSFQGKVVPLASRCSVHCKSDITHKLNRQEATPEDILHTLHDSMAGKVVALLEKAQRELRRVLLIGGLTRNAAMLAALAARNCRPRSSWCSRRVPGSRRGAARCSTRDEPRSPIAATSQSAPGLGHLPPLHRYAGRVQVIGAPARPGAAGTARWSWEWMPGRPPPRRCCSTRRPGAWWPRITRARNGDPVAAVARVPPVVGRARSGNRPGRSGGDHRLGARTHRRLPGHRACL